MAHPASTISPTVANYLAAEELATEKHEFFEGRIEAMAGGTFEHSAITLNIGAELRNALKGKPCRAADSNMRIGTISGSDFVYPDVLVVCGPLVFHPADTRRGTLLNPRLVVEVLSDSTEAYNRGRKFEFYRSIETFEEYVLVSQSALLVETFFRTGGSWAIASFRGQEAIVRLRSLELSIAMKDIYDGVTFAPTSGRTV